jgi:phospholipase C
MTTPLPWTKAKLLIPSILLLVALGCGGTAVSPPTSTTTPATSSPMKSLNHIVWMFQENRSFDTYFGQLGAYRAANGFGAATDIDGLPADASNPNGAGVTTTAYHFTTSCIENIDPDWLESFGDYNLEQPGSSTFLGDGFVHNAQGRAIGEGKVTEVIADHGTFTVTPQNTTNYYLFANSSTAEMYSSLPAAVATVAVTTDKTPIQPGAVTGAGKITASAALVPPGTSVTLTWSAPGAAKTLVSIVYDSLGRRSMGYYDGGDLPYYYFMANNFATSDRWFSPVPSNTPPNRIYGYAATTHGHVHDPGTLDSSQVKNIFQLLQEANVSWKVYYTIPPNAVSDDPSIIAGQPHTMLKRFQPWASTVQGNLALASQFFDDLKNGTFPSVAFIEELPGLDEHPGAALSATIHSGNSAQGGAAYAATFINAFMQSQYWKDGVFILAFDEAGGGFEHVQPMAAVSPDGIAPTDLTPAEKQDIVPPGDFTLTGFRVPFMLISPFAKKHYVSHTPADHTAILKLIETRFGLPNLTARDKAQMDMSEFFDFAGKPWATPPTPPSQPTGMPCDYTNLK